MMVGGFDDGCLPGVGSGALWPVEGAICLLLLFAPLESLGAVLYSANSCRRIRQSAAGRRTRAKNSSPQPLLGVQGQTRNYYIKVCQNF